MSVIRKRIEKNKMIISSIVNTYFLADQNQKLLGHLLDNPELLSRWKDSYAMSGVNSLRFSLYMHVLSEMRAILFDSQKRVASVRNMVECLNDEAFIAKLKEWFCDTSNKEIYSCDGTLSEGSIEHIRLESTKLKAKAFDEILDKVKTNFQNLKESEVGIRVNNARNKMISHKEFSSTKETGRKVFDASDFGLVYSDARDIVEQSHDIIFPIYSLFTKSHLDSVYSMKHHELVATEFWSK